MASCTNSWTEDHSGYYKELNRARKGSIEVTEEIGIGNFTGLIEIN